MIYPVRFVPKLSTAASIKPDRAYETGRLILKRLLTIHIYALCVVGLFAAVFKRA